MTGRGWGLLLAGLVLVAGLTLAAAPLAEGACQGYADLGCCLTGCCS